MRFILALPARAHVGYEEFSKAKMFPVHKRVDQLKMNHMFNIIQGLSPAYITLSVPGYFRQLMIRGGALKAPPPLRSRKL